MMRLHSLLIAAAVAACSGSNTNTSANVAANNSSNNANISRQAAEPRSDDPTAAQPRPMAPASAGTSVTLAANEPAAQVAPAPRARTAESTPSKISARHVLIQWMGSDRAGKSVLRTKEQAQVLAQEVLKRAKAGDDIGRLAVEYSDEPNAGTRGGSLGRFGKGQMVGAFEQTAFQLDVGEISGVVETPFGFHIIQRTE